LREFAAPAEGSRGDRALLLTCAIVAVPLQYFFVARGDLLAYTLFISGLRPPRRARGGQPLCEAPGASGRIREPAMGLVLCVWCISHVPALLALDIPGYEGRDAYLFVFFILVVQASDVLQYLWGKFAAGG
jgi:phosphatidate cytidylyltransferase